MPFAVRWTLAFAVLTVAHEANALNRIRSKRFAFLAVSGWKKEQTSHGRQGKSAAFGRAHVVGAVEVLRGIGNDQAVAPFQIVKEINAASAVGVSKIAVRLS
ncbi:MULTISPECIES: hypothetical protein [unclassified Bradyrhizobium]|uniref:hypothetical protein n=1 Tax=unclassified Bradyrhizobium TaxID=2631580 RepID=UPI002FF3C9E7